MCRATGGTDCGGSEIGDPVALPALPPQDGPLPFELPDLPAIDLPDLDDAGTTHHGEPARVARGPARPFGDTAPIADEVLDFVPEAGTVVGGVR